MTTSVLTGAGAEVSAPELARAIREGAQVVLLDVREPQEWDICHIEGAMLLPLGTLLATLGALDGHAAVVTYCHKGVRSLKALEILKSAGFSDARSLRGGIDAWSRAIDPSVPRY